MHKFLLILVILGFSTLASPQPPPHYYDGAEGLKGQELLGTLHGIIDDHVVVEYNSLYRHFQSTDRRPDGTVWDIYSDTPGQDPPYVYYYIYSDECGYYNGEGDCFDREHTWPKSWFGGQVYPMYSDLFIVYPADGFVNSCRLAFPYGETTDPSQVFLNGSRLGFSCVPGYTGYIFEPADAFKGDLARTYFYVCVRYCQEDQGWPGSAAAEGAQLKPWELRLLLKWHNEDPVSDKEVNRNEAIFEIQQNRNPFIDHPEFANLIWGEAAGIELPEPGSQYLTIRDVGYGIFRLSLPGNVLEPLVSLKVITLSGVISPLEFTQEGSYVTFQTSGLRSGWYLVIAETNEGVYAGKFLIQ